MFEVGRDPLMLMALPGALAHRALFTGGLDGAAVQKQQLQEVAPVQRQLRDLPLGDDLSD